MFAFAAVTALVVPRLRAQSAPPWINQDANWAANKEKLQAFGDRFATSDALYKALKQQAHGGKPLTWRQMAEPAYDWSGIYSRSKLSPQFDPDLPFTSGPVSARLTPAGEAVVKAKADHLARTGGEVPTRSATAVRPVCHAGSLNPSSMNSSSRQIRRG